MCGIFGLFTTETADFSNIQFRTTLDKLFLLSESRGKESSGIALITNDKIIVYKEPKAASYLIHSDIYAQLLIEAYGADNNTRQRRGVIGHARLVTNGNMEVNDNNQPVTAEGIVGIHNGIIVNDNKLWNSFRDLHRKYEVDTEIILALIRHFLKDFSLTEAVKRTFHLIEGAASIGVLFEDIECLLLSTNTGSLYICSDKTNSIFIFASEKYILSTLIQKNGLSKIFDSTSISQVKPGSGLVIHLKDLNKQYFSLNDDFKSKDSFPVIGAKLFNIVVYKNGNGKNNEGNSKSIHNDFNLTKNDIISLLDHEKTVLAIQALKRCKKCILPETMPFIEFDENGVCNYCRNYKKVEVKGEAALEEFVAKYRSKTGEPDCIVTFSGGRDSSYGLHYIKTVLKMNPIAYSYDWGMITDLARRNQARICGKLGVEHILVSADIKQKRENIRKNIIAWFKKPHLGMVPLFMAGDKQYFYYANKLRKQTGIKLIVLCECPYEKTNFKSGFCGVRPNFVEKSVYSIPMISKIQLASYYAGQYLINPTYINQSLIDTLFAFFSYYMMSHEFLKLYEYIKWDENKINSTLISEYDWETAIDTKSTWRIGDGTAPFYNYIYYTMAGFTENDTFRSNQIREGLMTREEALALTNKENEFRYESFKWYCDVIGLDFVDTIKQISKLPRLYKA